MLSGTEDLYAFMAASNATLDLDAGENDHASKAQPGDPEKVEKVGMVVQICQSRSSLTVMAPRLIAKVIMTYMGNNTCLLGRVEIPACYHMPITVQPLCQVW